VSGSRSSYYLAMNKTAAWTLLLATGTSDVYAQTPAPAPAPAPVVTEIVVTGERPAVETRVDRKVYVVSRDLQAAIGNATDVLRNVPSVSLDIEGNPSLRGDSSVQIFIDGRPAPEFNGANRGAALE
jgi:outer membrane receptor protein involved in Fe transport